MPTEKQRYSNRSLILGGIAFGLYYTICLIYLRAFDFDRHYWVKNEMGGLKEYLWAALVLAGISILMAFWLYGNKSTVAEAKRPWLRKLGILGIGHLGMLLALTGYGIAIAPEVKVSEIFGQLLIFLPLVGILPSQFVLILVPTHRYVAPPKAETAQPLDSASSPSPTEHLPTMLVIEASQGEPQFKVPYAELIAVEAADNYCKFHYLKDAQHKTKMLRMTMKEAEEALQGAAQFYRCHRSFLVNAAMVEEVLGNSQAYRLKVQYMEELVPVSRSFDIEPLRAARG